MTTIRKIESVSFSINSFNFGMLADIGQLMAESAIIGLINWIGFKDYGYPVCNGYPMDRMDRESELVINRMIDKIMHAEYQGDVDMVGWIRRFWIWTPGKRPMPLGAYASPIRRVIQSAENPNVVGWVWQGINADPNHVSYSKIKDSEYLRNRIESINPWYQGYIDQGWVDNKVHSKQHYNLVNDPQKGITTGWDSDSELLREHEHKEDIIMVLKQWYQSTDLVCYSDIVTDESKDRMNEEQGREWFSEVTRYDNGMSFDTDSVGLVSDTLDEWSNKFEPTIQFNSGLRMANAAFNLTGLNHWKGGVFNPKGFSLHVKIMANKRSLGMLELSADELKKRQASKKMAEYKEKKRPVKRLTAKERERLFREQFLQSKKAE